MMKKRILSLLLAASMMFSMIPIIATTSTAAGDEYDIQLIARYGRGDWGTNENPFRSNTVTVVSGANMIGLKATIDADLGAVGEPDLITLAFATAGMDFRETAANVGRFKKPEASFANAEFRVTRITINDAVEALQAPFLLDFIAPPWALGSRGAGYVFTELWNGWNAGTWTRFDPAKIRQIRLDGDGTSFGLMSGRMAKIEVEFDVLFEVEPCKGPDVGGVSVVLAAREAIDWSTSDGSFWRSPVTRINRNQEYTMSLQIPAASKPDDVFDRIVALTIMSENALYHTDSPFCGKAFMAPVGWGFNEKDSDNVKIDFTSIKLNGTHEVGTNWNNENIVSEGYDPSEGYINVELWNGFSEDSRRLTTGRALLPSKESTMSFGIAAGTPITSVTVTFKVSGIRCTEHGVPIECDLCVADGKCGYNCGEAVANCTCVCNDHTYAANAVCGVTTCSSIRDKCKVVFECKKSDCANCKTTVKVTLGVLAPGATKPSTGCALEILKFMVNLPSVIKPAGQATPDLVMLRAACIVTPYSATARPGSADALEILKHIVNLPTEAGKVVDFAG